MKGSDSTVFTGKFILSSLSTLGFFLPDLLAAIGILIKEVLQLKFE
jgi:hypothetical protein